ncbi:hypothetical protein MGN01_12990 [Methylobacterium gnaphalii]|uniref:Uncharacterized protein n=1 Tax=Methylobacterium gnaphalii TaxID=1010610 RepID=A0A512JHN0_9HYPH|nr:hypothetical protein MGN01_12990 [Methylobacterium gnaphalii]GLS49157.1 hypothetical protein GCM10007885_20050 [Methylobacterium gnaphalii]
MPIPMAGNASPEEGIFRSSNGSSAEADLVTNGARAPAANSVRRSRVMRLFSAMEEVRWGGGWVRGGERTPRRFGKARDALGSRPTVGLRRPLSRRFARLT